MRRNGKILGNYNLSRMNQEEVENLNRLIISKHSESVNKNLPMMKRMGPDGFTGGFNQTFKEKFTMIFFKSFQKIEG